MSGIAGSLRFDGGPAETSLVRNMAMAMGHRGPDGISHWSSDHAAFSHLLLRSTEKDLAGTQPLESECGKRTLLLDGRIDNWEELRKLLIENGVRLRTRSDAEMVLSAYTLWGPECLRRFEGDFAFVLWDAEARRAICARDPMGQKPLFYHWDGRRFLFASELRPVLDAMSPKPDLNEGVVAEMIGNSWISRDETLWSGILRVVPGHSMVVSHTDVTTTRYWYPEKVALLRHRTDADYAAHYRATLTETVRRLSRSHAPVGYDVSGGLDSSSVFATAHELHEAGQLPAPDITGFTMLFDHGTDAYELDYARAVGRHTGRSVEEVAPTYAPLKWYRAETLRQCTLANMPNGLMHLGTFTALYRQGGRAYLNGIGGDQWLGFGDNALAETLQLRDWAAARRVLAANRNDHGILGTLWRVLRHGAYPLLPEPCRALARQVVPVKPEGQETGSWLSASLRQMLEDHRTEKDRQRLQRTKGLRIGMRQRLMAVQSAYLQFGSELMEGMGQRAGVEIRSPLLNRTFVEFCLSLPMAQLQRGTTDRFIHRSALKGVLPNTVVHRSDKAEFSVVGAPLRAELGQVSGASASNWVDAGRFKDVQACALDPDQSRYSWPEGMLLCYVLLTALAASTDAPSDIEEGSEAIAR